MALQRENQLRTGLLGPCHDQQAAGVLVNSMDKTCSGQSSLFGVMVNDGIGQRKRGTRTSSAMALGWATNIGLN